MILLRKIKTFQSLPPDERGIFYRFLVLLPVVAWRVQFLPVKSTDAWLRSRAPLNIERQQDDEVALVKAQRITWLMSKALRISLIKGKCLSQSLVLWHILDCQGITSRVRVGFKKDEALSPIGNRNFSAHAWVEYQGVVLNDHPDVYERFVVFDDFITPEGKS